MKVLSTLFLYSSWLTRRSSRFLDLTGLAPPCFPSSRCWGCYTALYCCSVIPSTNPGCGAMCSSQETTRRFGSHSSGQLAMLSLRGYIIRTMLNALDHSSGDYFQLYSKNKGTCNNRMHLSCSAALRAAPQAGDPQRSGMGE